MHSSEILPVLYFLVLSAVYRSLFFLLNYIQTTYNDCQLSEVRQKCGGFYVQLVLLSQATGYVSRGNLSNFDIIGSNARGTAGNNILPLETRKVAHLNTVQNVVLHLTQLIME